MKSHGKLIVIEGIDGSGKSTLVHSLKKKLTQKGYTVVTTEWRSTDLISQYLKKLEKNDETVSTRGFTMLNMADFFYRHNTRIVPALKDNLIVLADRYWYTEVVRDHALKLDPAWTAAVFDHVTEPDLIVYLDIDAQTAQQRVEQRASKANRGQHRTLKKICGSLGATAPSIFSRYDENGDPITDSERSNRLLAFQEQIRKFYGKMFQKKKRVASLNAALTAKAVFREAEKAVHHLLR